MQEKEIAEEPKPKVIFDKNTNRCYEFFELTFNRQIKRDFLKKGYCRKTIDEKGILGILVNGKDRIIGNVRSSMKIGDFFEGHRVMDVKFDKSKITNLGKEGFMIAFIYYLD